MYEQWPKKMDHQSRWGSSSLGSGPGGTRYPGKRLPSTEDGTKRVVCDHQSRPGGGGAGKTYPKKDPSAKFGHLRGLPR